VGWGTVLLEGEEVNHQRLNEWLAAEICDSNLKELLKI